MALVKCPECSREVSDKAEACPQCSYPIKQNIVKIKVERDFKSAVAELDKKHLAMYGPDHRKIIARRNKLFLLKACIVFAIAVFCILAYSHKNDSDSNSDLVKLPKETIAIIRRDFILSKNKLASNKKLSYFEVTNIKHQINAVTPEMVEFKEAQSFLPDIERRMDIAFEEKSIIDAKERKAAEDAKYTKAGKRVHAKHPDWDADTCNAVGKGHIYVGMTDKQVRAAWGKPYDINRTTGSFGVHEQWVMHEMGGSYVYFEDGICTSFQN